MSSVDEECKGCISYDIEQHKTLSRCSLKSNIEEVECPYMTCLVKMICKKIEEYSKLSFKHSLYVAKSTTYI